ncbi:MAG: hypothetical protein ACPGRE_06765 [Flavobacteriaceae bacterium]
MKKINLCILGLFCSIATSFAQEIDSLNTQVINVKTSYNPQVEEAYRIQSDVNNADLETAKPQTLNYQILPVTVASTFNPQKGSIYKLPIFERPRDFQNYLYTGYGSNGLPEFIGLFQKQAGEQYFDLSTFYYGAQNGIPDLTQDAISHRGDLKLSHQTEGKLIHWNNALSYSFRGQTWYGTPTTINEQDLDLINQLHNSQGVALNLKADFQDFFFQKSHLDIQTNFDNFDSQEFITNLGIGWDLEWNDTEVQIPLNFRYQNTSFARTYADPEIDNPYTYQNFDMSTGASLAWSSWNKFYLSAGFDMHFFQDLNSSEGNFYFIPEVLARFNASDSFVLGAQLKGDFNPNSIGQFNHMNPYLAPSYDLKPTYSSYDAQVQFASSFSNRFELGLNIGYKNTEDQVVFSKNEALVNPVYAYQFGNSFQALYDGVKTTYFEFLVEGQLTDELLLEFSAQYNDYQMETLDYFYNQAPFKSFLRLNYQGAKWDSQFTLFGNSKSYDRYMQAGAIDYDLVENEGFVDINLQFNYHFSRQFSVHLKLNNLLNNNYQEFSDYQTQGFQILGGLSYKFN